MKTLGRDEFWAKLTNYANVCGRRAQDFSSYFYRWVEMCVGNANFFKDPHKEENPSAFEQLYNGRLSDNQIATMLDDFTFTYIEKYKTIDVN